jgi:dipeptidyl aminopeptidase/acylaminoacyl peptidase
VRIYGLVYLMILISAPASLHGQQRTPATSVDLLSWKSVESVELSPDGRQVIFTTKEPDWEKNRFSKSIWVMPTDGSGQPLPLTAADKDDNPRFPSDKDDSARWSPDGSRIAFVSTRDGAQQIWTVDKPGGVPEKVTNVAGGVIAFEWSPDSRHIAFTALGAEGSFEAQRNKDAGVVINKWDFVIYKLLNNSIFLETDRPTELWLCDVSSRATEQLRIEGSVSQFAWSPDGQRIAVTIHPGTDWAARQRDDVIVYSLAGKKSQVIARGSGGKDWNQTTGYSNPVWSPEGSGLALYFKNMAQRWQAKPQLGIYRFSESRFVPVPGAEGLVLYVSKLMWPDRDRMLLENTSRGSRQLFWLSVLNGGLTPVGEHLGSESRHSFSSDGKTMAFVRGSTTDPPEVYVASAPFTSARRLTSLNVRLREADLPKFERVHWKSSDGVEVEGWLAKPFGFQANQKYPLLVMVHGGPGVAVPDDFEMYAEWPYPYRLAALRGYLVLFPNYRGTGSYSAAFSNPRKLDGEPVDDVVTGVRYLIEQGFVDEQKIGITGHSHGSWLGPVVLTRNPRLFRAASFAEGGANLISNYGYMPGWLNLNVHDYYHGGSPIEGLNRYLEMSPLFHVAGLTSPTLLEYGEQSLAVQGLEFQTALWRCGVPHELIVYPKTGHNMSRPAQEAESMERNLDWFDYWMLGKTDPSAEKQAQYERWKRMGQEMQQMRETHPCSNR